MKKLKSIIYILLICTVVGFSFIYAPNINAVESDVGGSISTAGAGCSGKNECWIIPNYSVSPEAMYGIRVTVVDGNGNMVSERSIDYLGFDGWTNIINNNKTYYRCTGTKRNRLSYLKGEATCSSMVRHDGTVIAKTLSWLPDIYDVDDAAETIRTHIINLYEDSLNSTFFNDIGYDVPKDDTKNNHYMIIEPVTMIKFGSAIYYGTYYELTSKFYDNPGNINSLLEGHMPLSLYIVGNSDIGGNGGYNSSNGTYFNGILKIANKSYEHVHNNVRRIYNQYVYDKSYGYGIGIFWMREFPKLTTMPTCDYNNSSHFATETSGPNGEDCCEYVIDNLDKYGITKNELLTKYGQCRARTMLDKCNFSLEPEYPVCGSSSAGKIADVDDWDCIYASAYSNDEKIKDYFLKYGTVSSTCSVYCRDEITYSYPSNEMTALAGNYFTVGSKLQSYQTYLADDNTIKITAASLGPITVSVTRECRTQGVADSNCRNEMTDQLNQIKAPDIEFAYESDYYNNPTMTLKVADSEVSNNINTSTVAKKTVTYNYSLPNDTYKYVSKNNGVSYKNISNMGGNPYITIGSHSPIHFTEENEKIEYQITIKKFNLKNFDDLFLEGQTMVTKFSTSIETYIKALIDDGRAKPTYINGLYYLDNAFVSLLGNNGYTSDNFLQSACGNTNNYTCYSNENGIYCYDENTYSNSERTYDLLNSCINTEVNKLKTEKASYKNDMLYECSFNVDVPCDLDKPNCCPPNVPDCDEDIDDPDPDEPSGDPGNPSGIKVIFRPISLDNPFPSIDADGRATGSNWCYINDCSNVNTTVDTVITNNRDVTTEEVYKELDPLYKITLTPALIKEIRNYNKKASYDDFNLECTNGYYCKSDFIRDTVSGYNFSNYFSGCGIKNKSAGLTCQDSDEW